MNTTTLRMELGDEVLHSRSGRIGRLIQVNIREVAVRFAPNERARMFDRRDVVPVNYLRAMAEVDEDEANAAAYRSATR